MSSREESRLLGGRRLRYQVRRSPRARRLSVTVSRRKGLEVVLPRSATRADLDQLFEIGESICPGTFPHASSTALGLAAAPFPYKMTTICFVGPSAYAPIHSALTLFREEFEAKIVERKHIPVTAAH